MKFKRALTLAEVLLVFVIVGIIATLTIGSVRPWERPYKTSYMKIYSALQMSTYNYMLKHSRFPLNANDFSYMLVENLNNVDNIQYCDMSSGPVTYGGLGTSGPGPGTNPGSCPTMSNTEVTEADFTGSTISSHDTLYSKAMVLTNSAYIWVIGNEAGDGPRSVEVNGITTNYYLVIVDLNGTAAPNSPYVQKGKLLPDIVALIVTERAEVIPLGLPRIDPRYLQVHLIIPSIGGDESRDMVSEPMTFEEAVRIAFGRGQDSQIVSGNDSYTFTKAQFGSGNFWGLTNSGDAVFNLTDSDIPASLKKDHDDRCKIDLTSSTEPTCIVEVYEYQ